MADKKIFAGSWPSVVGERDCAAFREPRRDPLMVEASDIAYTVSTSDGLPSLTFDTVRKRIAEGFALPYGVAVGTPRQCSRGYYQTMMQAAGIGCLGVCQPARPGRKHVDCRVVEAKQLPAGGLSREK